MRNVQPVRRRQACARASRSRSARRAVSVLGMALPWNATSKPKLAANSRVDTS